MRFRLPLHLFGILLGLFWVAAAWCADSNIGETSEIQFSSPAAADLAAQAASLGSPVAIYEYLRNHHDFVLYHGARSGSINTFLGGRGNDVDLAATLIAMLRARGMPARYAVGTIRLPSAQVMNWLGVENAGLAYGILRDQGIQQVAIAADQSTIDLEHVWVEVLVPYVNYRGAGSTPISCVTTPTACNWVPLDPSFKQRVYQPSGLDPYSALSFDYTAYYNALKNNDPARRDKNPLEIYQNQVLSWLQTNAPGKTLEDVADFGGVIPEQAGLLPASLPYAIMGAVRRYNSAADHDAAVPATEPKKWTKYVTVQAQFGGSPVTGSATVNLVDASTQRLTLSFDPLNTSYTGVFRLNGTPVGTPINAAGSTTLNGQSITLNAPFKIVVSMDGAPAPDSGTTDQPISATYDATIGGYYVVATGGESSNWSQVHRAAQQLLAANQQYKIVFNPADPGIGGQACDPVTHANCTAYLDVNGNGWDITDPKLVDNKPAMDVLTGGLLEVAARQYYAKAREQFARADALNHIKTPIGGFLGVVSSMHLAEYIDGTAFSIQPGGLLIDMKGLTVGGVWRIDQPASYSNKQFEFIGHIVSSLEHETWQELTGYDAISTVHGTQVALANGAALIPVQRNASGDTLPAAYASLGFSSAAPPAFTPHTYTLFGQTRMSWSYSGTDTSAGFDAILANSQGIATGDYRLRPYNYAANNGVDAAYSSYNTLAQQLQAAVANMGQLKTNVLFISSGGAYTGQDVVGAQVTGPAGFALASVTRTGASAYQYALNETSQHVDGVYPVSVGINLANAANTVTYTWTVPSGIVWGKILAINPANFVGLTDWSVVSYGTPTATTLSATLVQTSAHPDGAYPITLIANYSPYSYTLLNVTPVVSGGRLVSQTGAIQLPVDTSDNTNINGQANQLTCAGVAYTGTPSQLLSNLQGCFNNMLTLNNLNDFANFFNPSAALLFRATPAVNDAPLTTSIVTMRDTLYQADVTKSWYEYTVPSKLSVGPNYRFSVNFLKQYDTVSNQLRSESFIIANTQVAPAGGGFVTASMPLTPALSFDQLSLGQTNYVSVLPTFSNAFLTDFNTIGAVNNDIIKTPSTRDPVSTVTGNNYHDETDLVIKGRGIDLAFTRTYNSTPSSTKVDSGLGYGWVHSYGMRLKANDYGACPNCTPAQDSVNGNGKTSSISYTDERGGEHNYLVNESSYAVTPPQGEFDSLAFDTPSTGQHTLTFRNGTRYIFETLSGTLQTTPGVTARLKQIVDAYGNQLNFAYDASGRLGSVTDNLGISGRTGLVLSYDAAGHLKTLADWSGRIWTYSVDASGNLISFTNPLAQTQTYTYAAGTHNLNQVQKPLRGAQTAFTYYQNGRTFNYQNSLGNTETLDYDLYRKTTRVTDPRGGIREYQYDPAGRLTQLTEPDGAILQFQNQADGDRYSKTDGLGYLTRYSYRGDKSFNTASDTSGNVTREQDALNQTVDTTYGPYDQVASVTDKRGTVRTTSFHTSTDGTCKLAGKPDTVTLSQLTPASGAAVLNVKLSSYCWNNDGSLKSQTDYLDPTNLGKTRVTTPTYDSAAHLNVQSVTVAGWDGTSVTKSFTYDTLGRKNTETLNRRTSPGNAAPLALTTTITYDALDRATQVTDALGNALQTVFDANGQVFQLVGYYKQPDNSLVSRILSTRSYDAADRLIQDVDVLGNPLRTRYDAAGNVLSVTDRENHTSRFEYDAMNRRTAVIDANGSRSSTAFDLAGHPVAATNGNSETTRFQYDTLGRLIQVTDPLGYITQTQYDANNNPTCVIDANAQAGLQPKNADGCSVSTRYDELNRPIQVKDAANGATQTAYDLPGNVTAIIDAGAKITRYTYDALGRLIQVTDPLAKTTLITRDEAGNAWQTTNRLGQITQTSFDALNRPTRYDYYTDNASELIAYDPYGNLQSRINGTVAYSFAYDAKNRLTAKTDSRFGGKSLTFTYDKADNLLTKTDYQGDITEFRYDSANHRVAMKNSAYLEASYQHDGAGRVLSRILSDGAQTQTTWNADGQVTRLQTVSANGTVLNTATYTRDRVGNILTATDVNGITTYSYDALYRLASADYPGTANDESFTFDAVGNRLTQTQGGALHAYEYVPGSNRLAAIHTGTLTGAIEKGFAWDDEGRLTSQTGSGAKTLAWDQKNRATTMVAGGLTNTFAYDPMDYRVGRSGGTLGNRDYYLEGEHLEAEYSGTSLQAKYLRGLSTDELVAGFGFDANGKWSPAIYHHDNLMSVTGISAHDGTVIQTQSYSAFGDRTVAATGTSNNRLKYTGREQDADTGLYYYRARYYDPSIGRFISEDPLGFKAGVNFYAYVDNNPVNGNDPSGMDSLPAAAWGFGVGAVLGGLTNAGTQLWQTGTVDLKNVGWSSLTSGIAGALMTTRAGQKMGGLASIGASTNVVNYLLTTPMSAWSGTGATVAAASGAAGMLIGGRAPNPYMFLTPSPGLVDRALIGQMVAPPILGMGAVGGIVGAVDWTKASESFSTQVAPNAPTALSSGSSFNGSFLDMTNSNPAAAGGFLIYPNKPNTNQMLGVYAKP